MKIYIAYCVFTNCDEKEKLGVALTYNNAKDLIESNAQEENEARDEEKELKKLENNYFYLNDDIEYHIETNEIYDGVDFTETPYVNSFSLNGIDYNELKCSKCNEHFIVNACNEEFERCPYCFRLIFK